MPIQLHTTQEVLHEGSDTSRVVYEMTISTTAYLDGDRLSLGRKLGLRAQTSSVLASSLLIDML